MIGNYNDKSLMEKVTNVIEKSKKRLLEKSKYNEGDVVQLTNRIFKINIKKPKMKLSIKELRNRYLRSSY